MKRNLLQFLFLFVILSITAYHPVPANKISITITNLRNEKGQVLISLFKGDTGYPDKPEKAIRNGQATISGDKATISFTDLPAGKYAAVVLHDENKNMKMDKTFLGLPKEGYGFSNNVMGTFGPPSFTKASFEHTGDKETMVTIRLRY
jgi:uncharacterized protein (DUF2141 family)